MRSEQDNINLISETIMDIEGSRVTTNNSQEFKDVFMALTQVHAKTCEIELGKDKCYMCDAISNYRKILNNGGEQNEETDIR